MDWHQSIFEAVLTCNSGYAVGAFTSFPTQSVCFLRRYQITMV